MPNSNIKKCFYNRTVKYMRRYMYDLYCAVIIFLSISPHTPSLLNCSFALTMFISYINLYILV